MTGMLGSPTTINQIIKKLGPLVASVHDLGPNEGSKIVIRSVNSPDLASPDQVAFVTQLKYLEKAISGAAGVLCFPEKSRDMVSARLSGAGARPHFFSKAPELAMRETIQNFFQVTPYVNRDADEPIHPTAVVHPTAKVASGARVGAFAVIAKGVSIEADAIIAAHTVIESQTRIGARTVIHPFVYVGPGCDIGCDCEINPHSVIGKEGFGYAHDGQNNHYRIPHTGRVVIGDRVQLGSCVTVDRGTFADTRIEDGAILDNRIQISHNAVIGANSVITAGFVIAGSSKVGKNFLTGGNTAITGHINLCDNVQLAALSVVRKDINKPGAYGGNPLMPMRDYMRFTAAQMKVSKLVKHFRALLGNEEESNF